MKMSAEFEGQIGIVTGAARGLGFATAELMAQRGAKVILVDIDVAGVEKAAAVLQNAGHAAHAVALDLSNEDEHPRLHAAIQEFGAGRVDVLVNNAGGWRYSTSREISMSEWEWIFKTNVTSTFLTTRAVMDIMVKQKSGRIVNVASGAAHKPSTIMPHYAAAKASVISLTRSFAAELAPSQVLVNAVSPGPVNTEALQQAGVAAERAKLVPLGRVGEPTDIAEVILFLGSTRNRFVVGQSIVVNGGMFML
jgi:NAD(P)-dependent dehydrogenase (short-subunit alcohol dehydrogenase family)